VRPAPTFVDAFGFEVSINGCAYARGIVAMTNNARIARTFFNYDTMVDLII
jgi:hypothetical protein